MVLKQLNVKINEETIEKMKQVRKDKGIPLSQQVERAYLKSEF